MIKNATNQSQGMLLFQLTARQSFAIGTLKVKEIVPYTPLTAIPHSHPTVLGAANLRGETLPIIDMAKAVGYPPIKSEELRTCYIIITDCNANLSAFWSGGSIRSRPVIGMILSRRQVRWDAMCS